MVNRSDALFTLAKFLDASGNTLLWDDRKDWGYFAYYNREKGDPAIGYGIGYHPSPFHHWQVGLILKVLASLVGYTSLVTALNEHDEIEELRSVLDEARRWLL